MTLSPYTKTVTISNGTANDADPIEQIHVELYQNDSDVAAVVNQLTDTAISLTGLKTFNNGIKTDTIDEKTAAAGVNIDGVGHKDGMVTVSGTPTAAGQIGYASNALTFYNGSAVKTLATTDVNANPKGYIGGLAPVYASAATVTFKTGLRARNSANTADIELTGDVTVSLASSGTAGLDTGTEAANTWYYFYLIRKSSDGTCSVVASVTNEAVSGSITYPSGYDQKRQLPFSVRNDGSSNIIPFCVGYGWPYRPFVLYDVTESRYNGTSVIAGDTNVLNGGTSSSFSAVSLASFVPPISKTAYLFWLNNNTASAVFYGRIRANSSTTNPGAISANLGIANNYKWIQTTSSQGVEYIRDSGTAGLMLDVMGYVVTEVV